MGQAMIPPSSQNFCYPEFFECSSNVLVYVRNVSIACFGVLFEDPGVEIMLPQFSLWI